jgi:penicillin-binding protein 1A
VDAWFVGYLPRYTVAVWIGTDGTKSIGDKETGGKAALPIWSAIMDQLPNVPGERFPVPDGVLLLPYEDQWLGYARGTAPEKLLKVPELVASAPLPVYGFSPPSARPAGQAEVTPPPAPLGPSTAPLPTDDPEAGAGADVAADPADDVLSPATPLQVPVPTPD